MEAEIRTFTLPPEGIDRLDTWLTGLCEGFSRARIQGLMKAGLVKLNGTPVLALNAAAVGETLGEDTPGLLPDSEAETVAEAVHRLLTDEAYRTELLRKQGQRAKELSPETVGQRAAELLRTLWEK